jgi:uncharacterized protein
MSAEFSIPVADIDAGGKPFDFVVRPKWVRGALEDCEATSAGKEGSLSVRISRSGQDLVLRGRLKVELEAPCARCLKPAQFTVDQDLSLLFVPGKEVRQREQAAGTGELEINADDADTYGYEGETLVLDDIVRDELVLETPMIPLCSEDCPGIRPAESGADAGPSAEASENQSKIDPRLAPLLNLRLRTNQKE